MSERSNVDMADVLGDNYLVTSISASDYNPTIDGTVTLTVTVKDVYGDPISGEEVEVTCSGGSFTGYNGDSITSTQDYTGTTNASGQFTLTYSCTVWGLITILAGNSSTQLRVGGWKTIIGSLSNSGWQLERNETRARLITTTWSHSVTTSWQQFGSSAYAENVKPKSNVHYSIDTRVVWYIDSTSGKIYFKSATGSNIASTNFAMQWEWSIA